MAKSLKKYGRVNPNKLDYLLAIVCVVIAVAALWISIGISLSDAGVYAGAAFMDLVRGLGFVADAAKHGQSAVISAYVTVVVYESLLLLVLGSMYLVKKGLKDRIPGLVAEFVAAVGMAFFVCFTYEFGFGSAKASVNSFWPLSLIIFIIVLLALMVISTYMTFNTNVDVNVAQKAEVSYESEEVEEEKAEEQPEEKAEEPAEEPKEEPKEEEKLEEEPQEEPEEEPEEESDEEEAEGEGEEGNEFSALGKRRKRVPFENKMRRADVDTRERYKFIVSELRQYDFNDRKSIPGETFSYKREKLIFITFSGSTLKIHFRLDPKDYEDSPIPVKDAGEAKKYEDVPLFLKIKSDLAARRALLLAQKVIEDNNVPKK